MKELKAQLAKALKEAATKEQALLECKALLETSTNEHATKDKEAKLLQDVLERMTDELTQHSTQVKVCQAHHSSPPRGDIDPRQRHACLYSPLTTPHAGCSLTGP